MKKFIFLIIALIPVYAKDADSIYAWGYGSDLKHILDGVKIFVDNSGYLVSAAIAIGALIILYTQQQNITDEFFKKMAIAVFISGMFFTQTNNYLIEDEVTEEVYAINDIPVGIGETFSLFTNIERVITKAFESSFTTPNALNFTNSGLGFSLRAHLTVDRAEFVKGNRHDTLMEYISNCVANGIIDGQISRDLISSDDILNNIRVEGFDTYVYKDDGTSEEMACEDAYDNYIKNFFSDEADDYIKNNLAVSMMLSEAKTKDGLSATAKLFFNVDESAKNYVIQMMAKNMLKKGFQVMAMTSGGDTQSLALASSVSNATAQNQWQQAAIMTQKTLPMIKAYLTSILLAITPLLAILSIMHNDLRFIKMTFTLLTTLALISPLATVINYLIYVRLEDILPYYVQNKLIPMQALKDVNNEVASYLNFLGYVTMFIPLLAYSLVKGSEQGFVSLMSSIGTSAAGAANTAATQKVSGFNIGNSRIGQSVVASASGTSQSMGNYSTTSTTLNTGAVASITSYGGGYTTADIKQAEGTFSTRNGELASAELANFAANILSGINYSLQDSYNTEKGIAENIAHQSSYAIADMFANGIIKSDTESLNKAFGANASTIKNMLYSAQEETAQTLNKSWSDAKSIDEKRQIAEKFGFGGDIGVDLKKIVKFNLSGDGSIEAETSDGRKIDISDSVNKSDGFKEVFSETLSKNLSQSFELNYGIAKALQSVDNGSHQVNKNDLDQYAKTHSFTEKLSHTANVLRNSGGNLTQKENVQLIEKFIDSDEVLSKMYHEGDKNAKYNAISLAMQRIDQAVTDKDHHIADYNKVQSILNELVGVDLSSDTQDSAANEVNNAANNLDNIQNTIQTQKQNIEHEKVKQINKEAEVKKLQQEHEKEEKKLVNDANNDLDDFKSNHQVVNKEKINEKKEQIKNDYSELKSEPKASKLAKNIGKTIYNEVIKNEFEEFNGKVTKFEENVSDKFINSYYRQAINQGIVDESWIGKDKINTEKIDDLSNRQLIALFKNDNLNYNSKEALFDEIKQRIESGNLKAEIEDLKRDLDEIEEPETFISNKGSK